MKVRMSIPNALMFYTWHIPTALFAWFLMVVVLPIIIILGRLFPSLLEPYLLPVLKWGADWADGMTKQVDRDLAKLTKKGRA